MTGDGVAYQPYLLNPERCRRRMVESDCNCRAASVEIATEGGRRVTRGRTQPQIRGIPRIAGEERVPCATSQAGPLPAI
jgi:hypothetical protein